MLLSVLRPWQCDDAGSRVDTKAFSWLLRCVQELKQEMAKYLFVALALTVTLTEGQVQVIEERKLLPPIPSILKNGDLPTYNLWKHAERLGEVDATLTPPKVVLSPNFFRLINLVPQDSVHPLYARDEYADLRVQFLSDMMLVDQAIDLQRQATTQGGQTVTFTRDANGALFVNGIRVERNETFPDGTILLILESVPFGYAERVHEAFEELVRSMPPINPFLGYGRGPVGPPRP